MKLLSLVTIISVLQLTLGFAADQQSPDSGASGQDQSRKAGVDAAADATLQLQGGSVAAGVGYVCGHETVTYQGVGHKFLINGVSLVDVGAAKISATGEVTHLTSFSDFAGVYNAWSAGATVGACGSAVYMKNEHGVVIKLLSTTQGLPFNLSGNGVKGQLQS
jgi:hypothetical protein